MDQRLLGRHDQFIESSFAGLDPASESSQGAYLQGRMGSAILRTETKDVPLQVPQDGVS